MTSRCSTTLTGSSTRAGRAACSPRTCLARSEHTEVASFDVDSLIDYRSRRPVMTFAKDHWEHYDAPEISVSLLHD